MPKDFSEKILEKFYREKGWVMDEQFNQKVVAIWKELRPKYKEFKKIYPLEEIKKDIEGVERIKSSEDWIARTKDDPIILEYILMEGIEGADWLGANTIVTPTAEYDDIKRGVDFVVSFFDDKDETWHYLAIDATVKSDETKILREDILPTLKRLEKGELTKIKYFHSTDPKDKEIGQLELPKVVIKLKGDMLKELVDTVNKSKRELAGHPASQDIKKQIREQIESAIETIEKTRIPGSQAQKLIAKHQKILEFLE
jgi:hypothetical protein